MPLQFAVRAAKPAPHNTSRAGFPRRPKRDPGGLGPARNRFPRDTRDKRQRTAVTLCCTVLPTPWEPVGGGAVCSQPALPQGQSSHGWRLLQLPSALPPSAPAGSGGGTAPTGMASGVCHPPCRLSPAGTPTHEKAPHHCSDDITRPSPQLHPPRSKVGRGVSLVCLDLRSPPDCPHLGTTKD